MTAHVRLPTLHIELATTADYGEQPWPPCLMDGWHLVRTVAGRSTWRRISLGHSMEKNA